MVFFIPHLLYSAPPLGFPPPDIPRIVGPMALLSCLHWPPTSPSGGFPFPVPPKRSPWPDCFIYGLQRTLVAKLFTPTSFCKTPYFCYRHGTLHFMSCYSSPASLFFSALSRTDFCRYFFFFPDPISSLWHCRRIFPRLIGDRFSYGFWLLSPFLIPQHFFCPSYDVLSFVLFYVALLFSFALTLVPFFLPFCRGIFPVFLTSQKNLLSFLFLPVLTHSGPRAVLLFSVLLSLLWPVFFSNFFYLRVFPDPFFSWGTFFPLF